MGNKHNKGIPSWEQQDPWRALIYRIKNEGLDYALIHYSNWEDIDDSVFRELLKQYREVSKSIQELAESRASYE